MDAISPITHLSHYRALSKLGARRIVEAYLADDTTELAHSTRSKNLMAEKLVLILISLVLSTSSFGQDNNNDFKVFWGKFKTAVINSDKNTVASLSKFPIGMSYGIRSIKTKAELIRRYKEVFSQQSDAAKCFAAKEPEKDSTNSRKYSVACPDAAGNEVVIYEFERGASGWKFVRLDNINE